MIKPKVDNILKSSHSFIKRFFSLSFLCVTFSSLCFVQNDTTAKPWKSPFKITYNWLGINMPGKRPDPSLLVKDNIINGNLGTEMGFVFETGPYSIS